MERLPWFPCEQRALLEALGNMGQAEQHIYLIILLRIYDCGGVCRDTIDVLAMRTRHRRKVVQQAIENLFRSGRLVSDGNGGMSNPRADRELARMQQVRNSKTTGAVLRWEKAKQKQQHDSTDAMLSTVTDTVRKKDNSVKGADAPLFEDLNAMKEPPLDPVADYYRRGKEVLGSSSGGQLTKLLKVKGGNIALARAALETASTRGDARDYVAAMINHNGNGGLYGERTGETGTAQIAGRTSSREDTRITGMVRAVAERRARRVAANGGQQELRGCSGAAGTSDAKP